MIHSGAVIAAGVSQGRSTTLGFDLKVMSAVLYTELVAEVSNVAVVQ